VLADAAMAGIERSNRPTKGLSGPYNEPTGTYVPAWGDAERKGALRCTPEAYPRCRAKPRGDATVSADLRANGGVAVARKHTSLTAVRAVVAVEAEEGPR